MDYVCYHPGGVVRKTRGLLQMAWSGHNSALSIHPPTAIIHSFICFAIYSSIHLPSIQNPVYPHFYSSIHIHPPSTHPFLSICSFIYPVFLIHLPWYPPYITLWPSHQSMHTCIQLPFHLSTISLNYPFIYPSLHQFTHPYPSALPSIHPSIPLSISPHPYIHYFHPPFIHAPIWPSRHPTLIVATLCLTLRWT